MSDDNIIDFQKYKAEEGEEIPPIGPYVMILYSDEEDDMIKVRFTPAYSHMTPLYKRFIAKILVNRAYELLQDADGEEWGDEGPIQVY